jgi:hypothetical protein
LDSKQPLGFLAQKVHQSHLVHIAVQGMSQFPAQRGQGCDGGFVADAGVQVAAAVGAVDLAHQAFDDFVMHGIRPQKIPDFLRLFVDG